MERDHPTFAFRNGRRERGSERALTGAGSRDGAAGRRIVRRRGMRGSVGCRRGCHQGCDDDIVLLLSAAGGNAVWLLYENNSGNGSERQYSQWAGVLLQSGPVPRRQRPAKPRSRTTTVTKQTRTAACRHSWARWPPGLASAGIVVTAVRVPYR